MASKQRYGHRVDDSTGMNGDVCESAESEIEEKVERTPPQGYP